MNAQKAIKLRQDIDLILDQVDVEVPAHIPSGIRADYNLKMARCSLKNAMDWLEEYKILLQHNFAKRPRRKLK